MKLWIRVATPLTIVLGFAINAQAQYAASYGMAGTGVYGGMQACPYNYGAGQAATSEDDAVSDIQNSIAQLKKEKAEKKRELTKAERDLKYARRDIDDVIADNYAQTLYDHMDNARSCSEYRGYKDDEFEATGQQGSEGQAAAAEKPTAGDFEIAEWNGSESSRNYVCNKSQRGAVNAGVCITSKFQVKDRRIGNPDKCKKALSTYASTTQKANKLRSDMEAIDRSLEYAKDDLKDARKDALQAKQDAQREQTEGGICTDCATTGNGYTYQRPQTDWSSVIANVGMGVLGTYLGYQQNKYVTDANANLGYPSNPYPAWTFGMPYLATGLTQALGGGSGVYGAMSGGIGAGGFGCAGQNGGAYGMYGPYGGANGTGMWGNPYAMQGMNPFGQMGGGIYANGMGPWGMAGPMGMGMNPYGAGGMSFVNGIANGYMGSYMGGMYAGGMYAGGMYAGSMVGGMYMGGIAGGMAGSYMGGMYAGGMYAGGMYAGSMVGGMYLGGIAGGGIYMGGGAYTGGMYMGGMGGYGTYTGAMTSGYAGDLGMMQMQQQMMQAQMAQYQAQMQAQIQRQQASSSVVQEIMTLQQKLYYIQSGAYTGSTGYIGGSGNSGYYGNTIYGTGTTTYPGGVIMGGGSYASSGTGSVTVPGSVPITTGTGTTTGVGTGR
ncbi:hypothetical protein B9G69_001105 [Bdellovibrio sp. SKB1291214]|uniref:hypothetical protein n=1 Tax=Bdellovibrio sp. SKB1291214 TaxID=1732569 RepID=UPI000B516FD5|nr:hypothetical protein [Bdellovibrio sp. SKB1291214]UYL09173.1 hypothetical protein B9G69_001105 [Bdellovibrio sp. SKB1291214]